MRQLAFPFLAFLSSVAWATIPAAPVMTLYRFNGPLDIPYYDADTFQESGPNRPSGALAQGTSVIPCLVIRDGRPLTDRRGTPYVGFRVVVDSRDATPAATEAFHNAVRARRQAQVSDHRCDGAARHVISTRNLYTLSKAPFFDPPPSGGRAHQDAAPHGELDRIVRAFHNSSACAASNRRLIGRRAALQSAWSQFIGAQRGRWSEPALQRAKHLDYAMRTAIFEGHLDRGCNAYGACERNIIALSLRNRARERCLRYQGCRFEGDYQGVATKVSQYNIWDEYLTQISGLTSCFLRRDLGDFSDYYHKLQAMYRQNLDPVQRILFGDDRDLSEIFPSNGLAGLKKLRHYYHAPAMGQCFPQHDRVEYLSGAVAWNGDRFALLANTRIKVDRRADGGYFFRDFVVDAEPDRDVVRIVDRYPGFIIDGRKIELKPAGNCPPYGIPRGCSLARVGRYRKTPSWLDSGRPLAIGCRVADRGERCRAQGTLTAVTVGGACDTQMRPVSGIQ